ncbi:response regulator transcription factor [Capillimicrobium parvum]|uniref:Transcriptional regulatory protein DegU n=1 Tax=Capillimicrobium parvum TaxID=2884022 RepID=A0A9E6Y2I6_9ACTN|nr:response regulator transcription factor [Capillimicrobium parvum]UGS39039.1 Transcriptional regulatory protein DegU [Capillimicrobium parvum]
MTRLAIVDDHEALREGLEALMVGGELEVVGTAGNAAAALDVVEHARPDVVLVDIGLPDASGIELARQLIARHRTLRVVLYTEDADADLLYAGLDAGAAGYVLKAGPVHELVAAVAQVAAGGTYVDPRLDRVLESERTVTRVSQLSPREREVMHLMAEGLTAEAAGGELGVSVETVRTHVRNAVRKLQARNRVHAIALALERGEVSLGTPSGAHPPSRGAGRRWSA